MFKLVSDHRYMVSQEMLAMIKELVSISGSLYMDESTSFELAEHHLSRDID